MTYEQTMDLVAKTLIKAKADPVESGKALLTLAAGSAVATDVTMKQWLSYARMCYRMAQDHEKHHVQ